MSVGNTLDVAGNVVDYYGLWEFSGATASNVKTGSTPDYGEPVEATNEFLASFATKPLIKYIHAVGEQSGQDITVGDNKLRLSEANSSTDGKTVSVYGFTYGYHSTNKYVQFVATYIAEDPTAPKLSVTPTSKTWASEEINAAVFNVTTNTEGENGWSVSPTTLDWATIAIDKTAGTITVTPKDANTAETAREATLTVSHSAGTLSETITLTQRAAGANAKPWSYTFTGTKEMTTTGVTVNGLNIKTTVAPSSFEKTDGTTYAARGLAWSKGSSPEITISGYSGDVEKVVLVMSTNGTSTAAAVKVGTTSYGKSQITSGTASANTEYSFTSSTSVSGDIVISVTNTTRKSVYLKAVYINPTNWLPSVGGDGGQEPNATVTTDGAMNISQTGATLSGWYSFSTGMVTETGLEYGTSSNASTSNIISSGITASFSGTANGLSCDRCLLLAILIL